MNHSVTKMKLFDMSHMLTSFAGSGIGVQQEVENKCRLHESQKNVCLDLTIMLNFEFQQQYLIILLLFSVHSHALDCLLVPSNGVAHSFTFKEFRE